MGLHIAPTKKTVSIGVIIVAALSLSVVLTIGVSNRHTLADTPTSFTAGRIIDDGVFTDTTTMNAAQIQTFLNSKVPTCDTNGTQPSEFGGGTRAQWAANASLHPTEGAFYPPFTCLKDYTENGLTSAQIIYNTAQQYQINPEVLIVLLQKEEGLITDTWPSPIQYQSATGYGCPDNNVCSSQYYGLTNQIQWSAKMFHAIETADPNWYTPYVLGNNFIQYSPDSSCGGSVVSITNRATQALYNYTPYQPNTAAVAAPMGTSVSCGAYGNLNFWKYFTQWFGTTYSPDYSWRVNSQQVYTDAAMTQPANTNILAPGVSYYVKIQATNTGNTTWTNATGSNPVLVGTSGPDNRTSAFCDPTWITCQRASSLVEQSVAPQATGTFTFKIMTPVTGSYKEYFNLVVDGKSWFNDIGLYWNFTVLSPTDQWQPVGQQIYLDAAHTMPANVNDLSPSTTYYASISALNNGNTTWSNTGVNPVNLGTSSPRNRNSSFYNSSWLSQNRPATLTETTVTPGQTGHFNFTITTPSTYGTTNEYFTPVVDGTTWMNDVGFYWPLTVAKPTPMWQVVSQNLYTDSTMTTTYDNTNTVNGARIYVSIKALNNGNTIWTNSGSGAVKLGTNNPQDRSSVFYDSTWSSINRVTTLQESSVAPGQVGTFNFWVTAPYEVNATTLSESFRLVIDGSTWFNDIGMYLSFTFNSPLTTWSYVGQSSYSNSTRTSTANLASATRNTSYYLQLKAKNTSGGVWKQSNTDLGTSNPQDRTSSFYDNSWIATNRATQLVETSVAPGQVGTFNFTIDTPNSAITSKEYFTPVIEGQSWMTDLGLYWNIVVN